MCVAVQGAVTFDDCAFRNNSATDGGARVGWAGGEGAERCAWRCRMQLRSTTVCLATTARRMEVGGGWGGKGCVEVQVAVTFDNNSATDGGGWGGGAEGEGAERCAWRCRVRLHLTAARLVTTARRMEVGGWVGWRGRGRGGTCGGAGRGYV